MLKPTMEEHALVIDFLPYGKAADVKKEPIAQVVGEAHFTLLEVVPKPNTSMMVGERVYVGKDAREKIDHIKGRISYFELTSAAKVELERAIMRILESREKEFVEFFNRCGPVTIRLHQLELLPGIGKKHLHDILKEREKKPFESFADISARIPLLPDPKKILVQRVLEELQGGSKYYLLTRPPYQPREGR